MALALSLSKGWVWAAPVPEWERWLRAEGDPSLPESSPVQEVSGKVGEEVGQEVVGGVGPGSEAQVEHAWRGRLGAWPGCLLLWDLKIPAGGPAERLLFLDRGQRLWDGKGEA